MKKIISIAMLCLLVTTFSQNAAAAFAEHYSPYIITMMKGPDAVQILYSQKHKKIVGEMEEALIHEGWEPVVNLKDLDDKILVVAELVNKIVDFKIRYPLSSDTCLDRSIFPLPHEGGYLKYLILLKTKKWAHRQF